jgi:hypothetical protein
MNKDLPISEERLRHTPGPWWIHREFSTLYIEGKARDERVVQEVAAIGPKEGGSEQQAADAQLIAAAPEMFELLETVLSAQSSIATQEEWLMKRKALLRKVVGNE